MGKKARNAGKKQSKTSSKPSVLEAKLAVKEINGDIRDRLHDIMDCRAHNTIETERSKSSKRGKHWHNGMMTHAGRDLTCSSMYHAMSCYPELMPSPSTQR